jgi:alpha-tubulin suppressor-like RCC1 family protein
MRNIITLGFIAVAFGCGGDAGVGPEAPDPTPRKLGFLVQPSDTEGTLAMAPALKIEIQDENGSPVAGATATVNVALANNPNGASLTGTTTVSSAGGTATFSDLRIDQPGMYRLVATSPGLTQATSAEFRISLTVLFVAAGGNHTCANTVADVTYCWGSNNRGQLGYQTPVLYSRAVRVVDLPSAVVLETLSLGSSHSCGMSSARSAYCWGAGIYGTPTFTAGPYLIAPPTGGGDFFSVEANDYFSCGVAASGSAYCWGQAGYEGRLGDGTFDDRFTPTRVHVSEDVRFRRLSRGYAHTCGITESDALYCWGWSVGPTPSVFAVPGSPVLSEVAGGLAFMCAVSAGGTIYCWGDNMFGQLGNGTAGPTHVPTPIAGDNGQYVRLAVGGQHACGLTAEGSAYCWGHGGNGQLGNGAVGHSNIPVLVSLPSGMRFVGITAGHLHTCAWTEAGAVYCWGENSVGELGVAVPPGTTWHYTATPTAALR